MLRHTHTVSNREKFDTSRPIPQNAGEEMNAMFVTIKAVRACSGVQMSRWHLSGPGLATVEGFV
jgi:hypothetical protein